MAKFKSRALVVEAEPRPGGVWSFQLDGEVCHLSDSVFHKLFVDHQPRIYYFGVRNKEPGHYLWKPPFTHATQEERRQLPWPYIDGGLCREKPVTQPHQSEEVSGEGEAFLHHKGGWTALAFVDRSGDPRSGSNSAFFAEGDYTFEQMLTLAKSTFPIVWRRITFNVLEHRATEVPTNGPPWILASSSNILRYYYIYDTRDAEMGDLVVGFRTGSQYRFKGVPRHLFDSFCASSSKGGFFNEHIKGKFETVTEPL